MLMSTRIPRCPCYSVERVLGEQPTLVRQRLLREDVRADSLHVIYRRDSQNAEKFDRVREIGVTASAARSNRG